MLRISTSCGICEWILHNKHRTFGGKKNCIIMSCGAWEQPTHTYNNICLRLPLQIESEMLPSWGSRTKCRLLVYWKTNVKRQGGNFKRSFDTNNNEYVLLLKTWLRVGLFKCIYLIIPINLLKSLSNIYSQRRFSITLIPAWPIEPQQKPN